MDRRACAAWVDTKRDIFVCMLAWHVLVRQLSDDPLTLPTNVPFQDTQPCIRQLHHPQHESHAAKHHLPRWLFELRDSSCTRNPMLPFLHIFAQSPLHTSALRQEESHTRLGTCIRLPAIFMWSFASLKRSGMSVCLASHYGFSQPPRQLYATVHASYT